MLFRDRLKQHERCFADVFTRSLPPRSNSLRTISNAGEIIAFPRQTLFYPLDGGRIEANAAIEKSRQPILAPMK